MLRSVLNIPNPRQLQPATAKTKMVKVSRPRPARALADATNTAATNTKRNIKRKNNAALLKAAAQGDEKTVVALLTAKNCDPRTHKKGATPLMLAAQHGHLGCVHALLTMVDDKPTYEEIKKASNSVLVGRRTDKTDKNKLATMYVFLFKAILNDVAAERYGVVLPPL